MGFYHSIVEKKNTKKKEGSARVRVRFGLPFYFDHLFRSEGQDGSTGNKKKRNKNEKS